jgi:bromodomain-containing protein 8
LEGEMCIDVVKIEEEEEEEKEREKEKEKEREKDHVIEKDVIDANIEAIKQEDKASFPDTCDSTPQQTDDKTDIVTEMNETTTNPTIGTNIAQSAVAVETDVSMETSVETKPVPEEQVTEDGGNNEGAIVSPKLGRKSRRNEGRKQKQDQAEQGEAPPTKIPAVEKEEESNRVRKVGRTPGRKPKGGRGRPPKVEVQDSSSPLPEYESEEENLSAMSSAVSSPYPGSDVDSEGHQAFRNWRKTIMLVWRHAAQHKYANLFLHPVKKEDAPDYYEIILRPMDLTTIKKNIETGVIKTDVEFQRDMLLMFQNAIMYNHSDHDVYKMAEEMRYDVMEYIQEYLLTQMVVQSSSSAKGLRNRDGNSLCVC